MLSLEAALEYIEENARVEVTPSQIRLRKVLLQEVQPYRAARRRARAPPVRPEGDPHLTVFVSSKSNPSCGPVMLAFNGVRCFAL